MHQNIIYDEYIKYKVCCIDLNKQKIISIMILIRTMHRLLKIKVRRFHDLIFNEISTVSGIDSFFFVSYDNLMVFYHCLSQP